MTTIILIILAYALGYWWGKKVGMAYVMGRMQGIMDDLRKIEQSFNDWNEDKL